jgi:hypothetical protein
MTAAQVGRALVEPLERRELLTTGVQIVPLHGVETCSCSGCACSRSSQGAITELPLQYAAASAQPTSAARAAAPAPKFAVKVDFRPTNSTAPLARGYRTDLGRVYAVRANGLTYGWNVDQTRNTVERNSSLSPDARYDTLTQMPAGSTWSIKVPNGWYRVNIFAGDPTRWQNSNYVMDVENRLAVNAKPLSDKRFVEGVIRTEVRDGKLTINSETEGRQNAIGFVHIQGIDAPAEFPVVNNLKWMNDANRSTPLGRVEAGVVRLGDKLYIMGGYTSGYSATTRRVDIYDIKANRWTRGADLPGSQTHAGATTDGQYIYWIAGQYGAMFSRQGTNEAWRYDPQANRWSRWTNLPEVRFGGALAYHNNTLYFYGGTGPDRVTSSNRAWKIATNRTGADWTRIADMPYASDHLGHAVINGEIYAIGGERDHNVSYIQHSEVYSYNPSSNTWRRRADMPTASSHFEGAVLKHDGKLWVVAGQIDAQQLTDEVRVYDPAADRWTVHTPFLEKRKGGAAWIHNGNLFYTTGDKLADGQPRTVLFTRLPTT